MFAVCDNASRRQPCQGDFALKPRYRNGVKSYPEECSLTEADQNMMREGTMLRWIPRALAAMCALGCLFSQPAVAAAPGRIVSINACTDQLLLALADRQQILAVTPFARDPNVSFYADRAEGLMTIRGDAEEVLKLKPDLVLVGSFTRSVTRAQLTARGIRVATFAPAQSVEDIRNQISEMASLLGQEERGRALIAELDAAFADLDRPSRPLRAIQLERRAFAAGADTLIDDIMKRLGIANAATELGIRYVGRTTLEAVLKAKPDLLILDSDDLGADDQGVALLGHPALERLVPRNRRIVIPENQIVCGSPAVALAAKTLRDAVERMKSGR